MNKRQAKKASKKVTYPIVDEMNLLTLSPEELKAAIQDFKKYVQRHCRYKHYKDRRKKGGEPFSYHFPEGEAIKKFIDLTIKTCRAFDGYRCNTQIAVQNIEE